jgi:ATP-binding cassette subfamily C protein EexD
MRTVDNTQQGAASSVLRLAVKRCKSTFVWVGAFSLCLNLLLLVPSVYMLQVYDRVLPSSSESTLLMLTLILVFLLLAMGGLEWIRSQLLIVASARLDQALSPQVFDAVFRNAVTSAGKGASAQPLSDVLQLRQFLTGHGLLTFCDAPWLPVFLLLMFLFHPYFGLAAVVSAGVLIALAVWNEVATRGELSAASAQAMQASHFTERNLRNAETIEAMGMLGNLRQRWQQKQQTMLALQGSASRKGGLISSLSRTFRVTVQSLILGLGAYLAMRQQITPGSIIAGSILLGRALAPLDGMIGSWRGFLHARDAYARLHRLLGTGASCEAVVQLPVPEGALTLDKLVVTPLGATEPVIKGINVSIEPGTQIAVIGPSGAGKSTLARAILGLYPSASGSVRLDGAQLDQWEREQLGQYIGYLPQRVELLDGTVSENIARFGEVDSEKVVEAARIAGVHEVILRFPNGYQTQIQGNSNIISAGQQQRIALARALYGDPRIILLDEPNSNLDEEGDEALRNALGALKAARRTVIVITHRGNVLSVVDKIMMIVEGRVALYGTRDEVVAALQSRGANVTVAAAPRSAVTPPVVLNQKLA